VQALPPQRPRFCWRLVNHQISKRRTSGVVAPGERSSVGMIISDIAAWSPSRRDTSAAVVSFVFRQDDCAFERGSAVRVLPSELYCSRLQRAGEFCDTNGNALKHDGD